MNVREYKIGTRLGFGFGIILLILVGTVLLTNVLNYRNKSALMTGLDLAGAKESQAQSMKSAMLETGIAMRNIGLQSDVSLMQKEEEKVKANRARYDAARTKLQSLGLNDAEKKVVNDITGLQRRRRGESHRRPHRPAAAADPGRPEQAGGPAAGGGCRLQG
jgi:methyl-accepting chemotaxis protein